MEIVFKNRRVRKRSKREEKEEGKGGGREARRVAGNPRQIIWAFYFQKVPLRNAQAGSSPAREDNDEDEGNDEDDVVDEAARFLPGPRWSPRK